MRKNDLNSYYQKEGSEEEDLLSKEANKFNSVCPMCVERKCYNIQHLLTLVAPNRSGCELEDVY